MKKLWMILLAALLLTGCARQAPAPETSGPTLVSVAEATVPETTLPVETPPSAQREPMDEELVRILDYLPGVQQELMYATEHNFTGQVIYDFQDAYLRYGTVKKLMAVREDLRELGLDMKIWDAFRPVSAQFQLWEVCPDPTYVANPNVGFSAHSRGNTVDLTLVDGDGNELEMPTAFDDFTAKADRDYRDCTPAAAANARILELLMEKHGFRGYQGEWWHFSDTTDYPVVKEDDHP